MVLNSFSFSLEIILNTRLLLQNSPLDFDLGFYEFCRFSLYDISDPTSLSLPPKPAEPIFMPEFYPTDENVIVKRNDYQSRLNKEYSVC